MYRPVLHATDSISVPQLVFSKLTATGADDARFRVALYALSFPEVDSNTMANALHISHARAQEALNYWEGAGLLEQTNDTPEVQANFLTGLRPYLSTKEVSEIAKADTLIAILMEEFQRILGGVVSQKDSNILITLYSVDKIPAELILIAIGYSASEGATSARYIEKVLLSWRKIGIIDALAADEHLKLLALRKTRENDIAKLLSMPEGTFTISERKKISAWYEEYNYGPKMVSTSMLHAGEQQNNIAYLNGILKKWFGKGYKTPQDVQESSENRNLRTQSEVSSIAPQNDILMNLGGYEAPKPQHGMDK